MVHPALLRSPSTSGSTARRPVANPSDSGMLKLAKRLLRRLGLAPESGYRPERHYMRGGRTEGAKSLAAG